MQTQYQSVSLRQDPYYDPSTLYSAQSHQYLATAGVVDFSNSFLGGSSTSYREPHEDYGYFFHRGQSSYRAPSTSIAGGSLGATGLGFTGNPVPTTDLFPPEEISDYSSQSWNWSQASDHGVVAPIPMLPAPPEVSFLPIKRKEIRQPRSLIVRSPATELPTPAAMAVLLNSSARSDNAGVYEASASVAMGVHDPVMLERPINDPPGGVADVPSVPDNSSREKKHACTMCHKRFDRPSTLRKHLLVHTGEKAFVCGVCGRRFGVASNLNRHARRCATRPVNMPGFTSANGTSDCTSAEETSPQPSPIASITDNSIARSQDFDKPKKKRLSISSSVSSQSTISSPSSLSGQSNSPQQSQAALPFRAPTHKRRRRAPSPSRWVPLSLRPFNLVSEVSYQYVSVPLPPIRCNLPKEERDSWDENVSPTPYHPCGWKGVLPGPGFLSSAGMRGKDIAKMNFGNSGGRFTPVGRVLVF